MRPNPADPLALPALNMALLLAALALNPRRIALWIIVICLIIMAFAVSEPFLYNVVRCALPRTLAPRLAPPAPPAPARHSPLLPFDRPGPTIPDSRSWESSRYSSSCS